MMFGFIILLFIVFYFMNPSNSKTSCCMNNQFYTSSALDILNERYARGEVGREDYLERKRVLSGQKPVISMNKG